MAVLTTRLAESLSSASSILEIIRNNASPETPVLPRKPASLSQRQPSFLGRGGTLLDSAQEDCLENRKANPLGITVYVWES